MDGLPQVPTPHQPQPQPPAGSPPQAGGFPAPPASYGQGGTATQDRPVGRPSADPEKDLDRLQKQQTKKRLESVLPPEATDSRIGIYRCRGEGRSARTSQRPIMMVMISELERAIEEHGGDLDVKEFIRERIEERYSKGRFQCVAQDHKGRALVQYSPWEVDLDGGGDDDNLLPDLDDEDEEGAESLNPFNYRMAHNYGDEMVERSRSMRGGNTMRPSHLPPPPPGMPRDAVPWSMRPKEERGDGNIVKMAQDIRDIATKDAEKQKEQSENTMALLMQMMSQSSQQQMASMQMMMQQQQAQSQQTMQMMMAMMGGNNEKSEDRRREEEQRRREEESREERRRSERADMMKIMITTMVPMLTGLFGKLTEKQPDVLMPLVMDMLKGDRNNNSSKEILGMMNEATKQQMQLQGEVSRQAMSASAEANKNLMNHVLGMTQQVTQSILEAERDTSSDDPMDKFQKVMRAIGPVLESMGQPGNAPQINSPQYAPATQAMLDRQRHADPEDEEIEEEYEDEEPPVSVPQQPQGQPSDSEKIRACLYTIMRLEQNEIPAIERVKALHWCAQNLPPSMARPIQLGDQNAVTEVGGPIFMADQRLMGWISTGGDYLQDSIREIQRILVGEMDEHYAKGAIERHIAYQQERGRQPKAAAPQAAPQAAPAPTRAPQEQPQAEVIQGPTSPPAEEPPKRRGHAPIPDDDEPEEDEGAEEGEEAEAPEEPQEDPQQEVEAEAGGEGTPTDA